MDSIINLDTQQKDLSIRVSSNGFSFFLSDQHSEIDQQFIAFNALSPHLAQLKDAVYSYPILFSGFRSYNLIVDANQYILTPSLLFEPQEALKQTNLIFNNDQSNEYFFEEILPISAVNCFSFNSELFGFLNRTFQFNQIVSQSALLILNAFAQRPKQGQTMFVYNNHISVQILIFSPLNLIFQACYPKTSPINCTYFSLKAWEIHQMSQTEDQLILIGDTQFSNDIKIQIEQFVKHITIKAADSPSKMLLQSAQKIVSNPF